MDADCGCGCGQCTECFDFLSALVPCTPSLLTLLFNLHLLQGFSGECQSQWKLTVWEVTSFAGSIVATADHPAGPLFGTFKTCRFTCSLLRRSTLVCGTFIYLLVGVHTTQARINNNIFQLRACRNDISILFVSKTSECLELLQICRFENDSKTVPLSLSRVERLIGLNR